MHVDHHPRIPLTGRGFLFDVYGRVGTHAPILLLGCHHRLTSACVCDVDLERINTTGGTYDQWFYYRGVRLPPEQFMNTYFSAMFWVPHPQTGVFQLYQMSAMPFTLPIYPVRTNFP